MPFNNNPPQNTNTDVMISMKKTHRFFADDEEYLKEKYIELKTFLNALYTQ